MPTVLVVDDMAVFREPIAAALRHYGYETLSAADGREALDQTRAHRPDLILLDVAMPVMDGLAFLEKLRADADIAKTPVILLTAVTERDYVLKARALGASSYLLKSQFSLTELLERVTRLAGPPHEDAAPPDHHAHDHAHEAAADVIDTIDPELRPAPARTLVQQVCDLRPDMSAAEIVQQIEQSAALQSLLTDPPDFDQALPRPA